MPYLKAQELISPFFYPYIVPMGQKNRACPRLLTLHNRPLLFTHSGVGFLQDDKGRGVDWIGDTGKYKSSGVVYSSRIANPRHRVLDSKFFLFSLLSSLVSWILILHNHPLRLPAHLGVGSLQDDKPGG
ncbi:hypothetical protein DHB64_18570 [Antarcticibacterium sp. W02-3]|nr:hypothetical protein [Antarcticibacterium sp. W02-3]